MAEAAGDLKVAPGVGGGEDRCAGADDVPDLADEEHVQRQAQRARDFRGDRGGWDRRGFGNPRTAVDRCVRAAENQARRFGGYRFADVIDIRDIDRTRDGFRVKGRIDVGGGWNNRGNDRGNFTCRLDGRGAPFIDFDGIRGLR